MNKDVKMVQNEPQVRSIGYNQYAYEAAVDPADRERFRELADEWQNETVLLSSSDQVTEHPAYQKIISLGKPAVPLILERM